MGPLILIIIAFSLVNGFYPQNSLSLYELMPRFSFSMPQRSPTLQALFHSLGEMFYRVVHFYDYWTKIDTRITYSLPFEGEWIAVNGGETPETSHSWGIINQRYAFDFIAIEDLIGDEDETTEATYCDFATYGRNIFAPADGVVILTQDNIPDSQIIGQIDEQSPDFRGNFVVIQHSPVEYSFLLHLIPGSVTVAPGDQVTRCERIGRCGNSGHSTQPHLHFHIQNTPIFHYGKGLKVNFDTPIQTFREYQEAMEPAFYLKARNQ